MSSPLSTWSRALAVALGAVCALLVVVLGSAAFAIVSDELDQTDSWDGLGTVVGLILGGFTTIVLVVVGSLMLLTRSGRAGGNPRRLAWAAGLSLAVAVVFFAWMLVMLLDHTAQPVLLIPLIGIPSIAVAVPATGTLVEAVRTGRSVST